MLIFLGSETYDVSNESAIVMGNELDERAHLLNMVSVDNYSSIQQTK